MSVLQHKHPYFSTLIYATGMSSAPSNDEVAKFVGIVKEVKWSDSGGSLTLKTKSTRTSLFEDTSIPIQHYNTAVELRRLRNLKVELMLENGRIIGIRTLPMTEADWE